MKFYIQHKPDNALWTFDIILMGDVRENALVVSKLFPGEEIVVWAHSRGRLVVRNGGVIRDIPEYDHFFEVDSSKVSDQLKMHEWKHLIASGEDMPLVLGVPIPMSTMGPINASYRNLRNTFEAIAHRLEKIAPVEFPLFEGTRLEQIKTGMKFLDSVFRFNDDAGITQLFGDMGIKDLEMLVKATESNVIDEYLTGIPVNVFSDEAQRLRNPNLPTPLTIGDLLAILRLRYTYMLAYLRITAPEFRDWKWLPLEEFVDYANQADLRTAYAELDRSVPAFVSRFSGYGVAGLELLLLNGVDTAETGVRFLDQIFAEQDDMVILKQYRALGVKDIERLFDTVISDIRNKRHHLQLTDPFDGTALQKFWRETFNPKTTPQLLADLRHMVKLLKSDAQV